VDNELIGSFIKSSGCFKARHITTMTDFCHGKASDELGKRESTTFQPVAELTSSGIAL
jgi:hypothetical protein